MSTTPPVPSPPAKRQNGSAQAATHWWTVTGIGLVLYIAFHILQMLMTGVAPAFDGREAEAMWTWTVLLGIALLPTVVSAIGSSRVIAWIVFALGVITVLISGLIGYQYGIKAGAGYIALTIAVFVLLPAGFALAKTLGWARGK